MRRLGARVDARLAIDDLAGERINFLVADAVVAALPSFAEIRAGVDLTTISAAEKRLGRGLEDDRAEVLTGNHRALALPRAVAFLKCEDAVDGANEQLIFRDFALGERLTSG